MALLVDSLDRQTFYRTYLKQGTRRDGRKLDEYRSVTVNVKSLTHADGSAIVRLGETTVICGVKAELAKPKAESPDEGYLIANIELQPICSPEYPPGPPSDRAQLCSTLLAKALLATRCVNLKQLCIVPQRLAWVLYVDVLCINEDGGLISAAVAAATAALQSLQLPKVDFDVETGKKEVLTNERWNLMLDAVPFASEFAFYDDNKVLHDPTAEEESLSSGRASIIACVQPGQALVVSVTGSRAIQASDMAKCMEMAKKHAGTLARLVNVAESSPDR